MKEWYVLSACADWLIVVSHSNLSDTLTTSLDFPLQHQSSLTQIDTQQVTCQTMKMPEKETIFVQANHTQLPVAKNSTRMNPYHQKKKKNRNSLAFHPNPFPIRFIGMATSSML